MGSVGGSMSEVARELVELKREVVESRNQSIKTDNQVKNLSLDVRGFEQRFDAVDRRTRSAAIALNILLACIVAGAAFLVARAGDRAHRREVEALSKDFAAKLETAQAAQRKAESDMGKRRDAMDRRQAMAARAEKILRHLDARRDKEAAELLPELKLKVLSPLERRLLKVRLGDFRRKVVDGIYRQGRNDYNAGRYELSAANLTRVLVLDHESRYINSAEYLYALGLWNLKRYEDAEPVLRKIRARETDKAVLDEARYYLATTLLRLSQAQPEGDPAGAAQQTEARALLLDMVNLGGRLGNSSRAYMAALDAGEALPKDLPGGRIAR